MIRQDTFVIVAKVKPACVAALREKLTTMTLTGKPGMADPKNALVPFGNYGNIHFARFVVLEENASKDRAAFDLPVSDLPIYLCFMADCDGSADELLARMARGLPGLKEIFNHCEGFDPQGDMLAWLKARTVKPSAHYVNWVGRSVNQIGEEACLQRHLRAALPGIKSTDPQDIFTDLKLLAKSCTLTTAPPTPLARRIDNWLHFLFPLALAMAGLILFLICLILHPVITIVLLCGVALAFVILLRRHEQTDPVVCEPYEASHVKELRRGEDHDVTNQYTAMGSLKPGRFRLRTETVILYGINWVARHICTRGAIGRIGTIHFAHWLVIENGGRGFFCSNYDGGHEAYMDDFINKAGFGLNLSFSSSIGYPVTNWLLARGAWLEQDFKRFQRHHQIPTDVWYKAYPGLTARDLARNSRIRNGFEKTAMSDDEIRRWLAEI
jgi:hypothetical protein